MIHQRQIISKSDRWNAKIPLGKANVQIHHNISQGMISYNTVIDFIFLCIFQTVLEDIRYSEGTDLLVQTKSVQHHAQLARSSFSLLFFSKNIGTSVNTSLYLTLFISFLSPTRAV